LRRVKRVRYNRDGMLSARWRALAVGYLVWLIALTVVEGLGREACRMPTAKWIAAGADARDRTLRQSFRDRADACLDGTPWHVLAMRALVGCVIVGPFAALWVARRRSELVRSLTFAAILAALLGSIAGVRWLYDWWS
jgi:hypothetical protein